MTTRSQVKIGVRPGYATTTSCKLAICSLYPEDVVVAVNGVAQPAVTLAAVGTDRATPVTFNGASTSTAGYAGSINITGLQPFTRYSYTVTQNGNSESGSFMTAPRATDDFSLFFGGCDNNTNLGGSPTGFYDKIMDYIQNGALPTVGMLFVDDLGYVDGSLVDDSAGTGHTTTGAAAATQNWKTGGVYNYALAYMGNLGLLQNTGNAYVAWGRDSARVFCSQNMNLWPQWGDHEFVNDIGWDAPTNSVSIPSGGTVSYATLFANGKAAWDALIKPLQPPSLGTPDTAANHWGFTLGPVAIVAPDGITNGNGTWDRATVGVGSGEPTVVFGNNQIDDVLNFLNTSGAAFNLIGLMHSVRYLSPVVGVYQQGAQHPLYNHILPEYQRLFTAIGNTPKSVMDNPKTNGVQGVTVCLHGDYHHACVLRHQAAAYTGNAAEQFYSVHNGTTNGSTNFSWPNAYSPQGTLYDGKTYVEYESGWVNTTGLNHNWAGLRIDVYGSKPQKEMHVIPMNAAGAEVWHGRFVERSSNTTFSAGYELPVEVGGEAL